MSIPVSAESRRTVARTSLTERLAAAALVDRLRKIRHGYLRLVDPERVLEFGQEISPPTLSAEIQVLRPAFYSAVALGGTVGAGESYIRGDWRCNDLTALIRLMIANRPVMQGVDGGWARLAAPARRLAHWLNRNDVRRSRRNISAHYDLGNQFFELFLDPTMAYSCALFEREDSSLEEASLAKFDAVCNKLALGPAHHVLEIGTGWGGLAIHAAQRYGCRVTTTTISERQYEFTKRRIEQAGLTERITLLKEDYRHLRGEYDALFSIEMVEAVGHQYLDAYFDCCSRLLKPTGLMLLQAITIRDQLYEEALHSVDYIKRFIFPGSFIPSVAALQNSLTRSTDMKLFHLEDIGPHYARTLLEWRDNLMARTAEARAQGFDECFIRMWEFYFCYCAGGFLERQLGDVQMLLAKPACRRAPIRSDMTCEPLRSPSVQRA